MRAPKFLLLVAGLMHGGHTAVAAEAPTCDQVIIDGPSVWAPHVVVGEDGKRTGNAFRFIDEIFKDTGITIVRNNNKYWTRTLNQLREGSTDIVVALRKTTERIKVMDFTIPWALDGLGMGVVVKKGREFPYEGAKSLKGLTGSSLNGLALPYPFNDPDVTLVRVPDGRALTHVVHRERVDYAIASFASFFMFAEEKGIENDFTMLEGSRVLSKVYMGVTRHSKCDGLLAFLNRRIAEIHIETNSPLAEK